MSLFSPPLSYHDQYIHITQGDHDIKIIEQYFSAHVWAHIALMLDTPSLCAHLLLNGTAF